MAHSATTPLHAFWGRLTIMMLTTFVIAVFTPGTAASRQQKRLSPRQFAAVVEARNLLEEGRADKAVATLKPLTKQERPPLTILSHLAWAQTETGDAAAACATYRRTAGLYPDDAGTARNLGILLLNQGEHTEAAESLERAYGLQSGKGKEPALLALAASALIREKTYDRALGLLDRACHDSGDTPVTWTSMAVYCCLRTDRIDEALRRCRTCARNHPASAGAWSLLSRVLVRKGDVMGAAAALETALSIKQKASGSSAMDAGTARELASLYARGHAYAEAALRLEHGNVSEDWLQTARFHHLAGQYEAALGALDADHAAPPPLTALNASLLRGRILMDMGRTDEAVAILTKSPRFLPSPDERDKANRIRGAALLLAGEALWLERNWTEAATVFDSLATIAGFSNVGSSLAKAMRALIRETTEHANLNIRNTTNEKRVHFAGP